MMVRLPFDVPTWQIVLSILILVFSFIGTTWIAGKNLPDRYFDVWQKSNLERTLEMGEILIKMI